MHACSPHQVVSVKQDNTCCICCQVKCLHMWLLLQVHCSLHCIGLALQLASCCMWHATCNPICTGAAEQTLGGSSCMTATACALQESVRAPAHKPPLACIRVARMCLQTSSSSSNSGPAACPAREQTGAEHATAGRSWPAHSATPEQTVPETGVAASRHCSSSSCCRIQLLMLWPRQGYSRAVAGRSTAAAFDRGR